MEEWTVGDDKLEFRVEDRIAAIGSEPVQRIPAEVPATEADEGPCLYLGPAGQRCYRPALPGGFCAAHQPGAAARPKIGKKSKLVAAIAGIGGALWPYIYNFIHQLIRTFHPR